MRDVEVRQHDDGVYYARPYLGTSKVTGKPIRPYKRFPEASSEDEALAMAREWAAGLSGAAALGTSMRLVDVLYLYIDAHRSFGWKPSTVRTYRSAVACYVEPFAAGLDVDEVRPAVVEGIYNAVMLHGGRNGEPISAATVAKLHSFLGKAFRWVVKNEISPFNPMPSVERPKTEPGEAVALHEAAFAKLSASLAEALGEGGTDAPAVRRRTAAFAAYLALNTGERVGEVCANTVADARLGDRLMHVGGTVVEPEHGAPYRQETPKSKTGRRNISLSDEVCARVRDMLEWQAGFLGRDAAHDPARTLCCDARGGVLRPSSVSKAFSALRDELGLPKEVRFHTLRHTHATWLLRSGVDMRTIQERLGHARVSTTLEFYAHVAPGRDRAAADAFDEVSRRIGGGS